MPYARVLSVLGTVAAVTLLPAFAQDRASPPRRDAGGQIPPGSYQRTCRGISLGGDIMRAGVLSVQRQLVSTLA